MHSSGGSPTCCGATYKPAKYGAVILPFVVLRRVDCLLEGTKPAALAKLDAADLLYLVTKNFAAIDLHPQKVTNSDRGAIFEELIRKFAETSNETAGEHFTPRDAVHLLVDLLLGPDDKVLATPGVVRHIYDPTAGTGGMLALTEEHIKELNDSAEVVLAGQGLNDQSYAICKSDMAIKGYEVDAIAFGDTLANDQHAGRVFDYCLANPPNVVEWKRAEAVVGAEHCDLGFEGRFGPGLGAVHGRRGLGGVGDPAVRA